MAVTSRGPNVSSEVDARFGRANFFVVVDTDTGQFTAHDNAQNLSPIQGAGVQAAKNVLDLGVNVVITGQIGPKTLTTLKAGRVVAYVGAAGSVSDAVERLKAHRLNCLNKANVDIDLT